MGEQHRPLEISEDKLAVRAGNDKCVRCGKPSPYTSDTNIDYRIGYIEGGGQGCYQPEVCVVSNETERELITIPKYLIEKYPNNIELGEAIRAYYWEHYK
jgi:hypothetical protein